MSVFSQRDNFGNNPGGELAPFFFFFFVGVIWFIHNCAIVMEGEDDNGRDDGAGNGNDEIDSDDGNNCRFNGNNAFFPGCFFAAILNSPFLIFFGGITIEEDTLCPLEGLPSDGNRLFIVFAMVQILGGVVFF